MTDTSTFLRQHQASVLWLLITDRNIYDKTIDQLSEDFFDGDGFKWVFRKLKEHTSRYDELPDHSTLQHYAKSANPSDSDSWEVENVVLPTIYEKVLKPKFLASQLEEFIEKGRAQSLRVHLVDDLENSRLDAFQDRMRDWHQTDSNGNRSNGGNVISAYDASKNPELIKPIERVSPWLSWEGNISLFSAREKLGKTTLAVSDAIRAIQSGKTVLWISADEGYKHQVRRLGQLGCESKRFFLTQRCPRNWQDASSLVARVEPDVVFVDSLS